MVRKSINTAEDKQATNQVENIESDQASPDAAQVDYKAYTRSRCGGALKTGREKQGLSVHDVANKLKISDRQIEAIEADQFADLPESTIVRGFIRNYAKLLKIEVEPLLDAYNVLVPSKQPLAFTVKPSTTMKVSSYEKPKTGRNLIVILLILLAIGVWYFYQNYIDKPSPTLPSANVENIESLPIPALPAAERVEQTIDIPLPANTTYAATLSTDTESVATANPSNSEQLASEPLIGNASPDSQPVQMSAGMAKLEFNANQETWISVMDDAEKEIYNKIIFAGSRDSLSVKLPVNVVIGNASGATISMNNKLVDLAPHTRSNVARIKLDKPDASQFE